MANYIFNSAASYIAHMDTLYNNLIAAGARESFVSEWMDEVDEYDQDDSDEVEHNPQLQPTVEGFALWLEGK